MAASFSSVEQYIATFPADVAKVLEELRAIIRRVAPAATETISYQIPTLRLNDRNLVSFAGWKNHISLYPVPAGDDAFAADIEPFRAGKGTVRFPFGQPLPVDLIERLVTLLMQRE